MTDDGLVLTEMNVNLLGFDRTALTGFVADLGEPSYRADQILKWVHQRNVTDFNEMTDLSKQLRGRLSEIALIKGLDAVSDIVSEDGTRKWLLELEMATVSKQFSYRKSQEERYVSPLR